jgi:lipoprotein NlpD
MSTSSAGMASAPSFRRRSARARALLVALAAASGCAIPKPAPLHPDTPRGSWHVVEPGETMAQIASRTGVPVEDLLEINGLRRNQALEPGQLLFLLDAEGLSRPASAPAPRTELPAALLATGTPLRWPLSEPRLSSPFGARHGRTHEGVDLAAPTGTPIYAADGGQVLYAGDAVRGYGNMVVVQHADDLVTVYAHSSVLLVRTGERVAAGQEIARVGQSGRATAPHLHFEVRRKQVPDDPLRYLPGVPGAKK